MGMYRTLFNKLVELRGIEETGQMGAWVNTILAIRENNRNLPALQDELNRAGL